MIANIIPVRDGERIGLKVITTGRITILWFSDDLQAEEFYRLFSAVRKSIHPELDWSDDLYNTVADALREVRP